MCQAGKLGYASEWVGGDEQGAKEQERYVESLNQDPFMIDLECWITEIEFRF